MKNSPTLLERTIQFLRALATKGDPAALALCEEIEERAKTAYVRDKCGVAQICAEDRGLIELGRKLVKKEKSQ